MPSTSAAGTATTATINPVSVNTLTRMLNPRPKNALVSPRVHQGTDRERAVGGSAGALVTSVLIGPLLGLLAW